MRPGGSVRSYGIWPSVALMAVGTEPAGSITDNGLEKCRTTWPNGPYSDLADVAGRRDALRQAAALPGANPRTLLDAAFARVSAG
jgi:hypothetical protein